MSKFGSSEIVHDESGRQYHIGLRPDDISDKIIIVGNPERARRVANLFESVRVSRKTALGAFEIINKMDEQKGNAPFWLPEFS